MSEEKRAEMMQKLQDMNLEQKANELMQAVFLLLSQIQSIIQEYQKEK